MALPITPQRIRSSIITASAALAVTSLVVLSALGSAASASADDIVEPTLAVTAPVEAVEAAEPTEVLEALEVAEPAEPAEPTEPSEPTEPTEPAESTDPAAAAGPAPVANDDLFPGSGTQTDLAPAWLYLNDSDTAPASLEIDDPTGQVTMSAGWIHVPIASGFSGNRTFKYRTTGASGISNWATVTVVVQPGAPQPLAYMDSYATPNNVTLAVPAPGVMANDDAPGGTVTGITDVTGQVVIHPNGSFEYTPVAGFVGLKTFYYQLTANGLPSNWGKVVITVSAAQVQPVAPVAVNDNYQTAQGVDLVVAANGVLANDSSQTAVVWSYDDITGETIVTGDGGLHYSPPAGFSGTKTLTYQLAENGLLSNWATITIEVTATPAMPAAPVAVNDKYQTEINTPLVVGAPGVLANDSAGIVWWTGGFYSGSMTLQLNGSFVYTPDVGFTGTAVIEYYILNNGLTSNIATITIEVVEPPLLISNAGDPDTSSNTGTLAFTGITSTWIALPAIAIFLLGSLALGYSAARRRRAGTV